MCDVSSKKRDLVAVELFDEALEGRIVGLLLLRVDLAAHRRRAHLPSLNSAIVVVISRNNVF